MPPGFIMERRRLLTGILLGVCAIIVGCSSPDVNEETTRTGNTTPTATLHEPEYDLSLTIYNYADTDLQVELTELEDSSNTESVTQGAESLLYSEDLSPRTEGYDLSEHRTDKPIILRVRMNDTQVFRERFDPYQGGEIRVYSKNDVEVERVIE